MIEIKKFRFQKIVLNSGHDSSLIQSCEFQRPVRYFMRITIYIYAKRFDEPNRFDDFFSKLMKFRKSLTTK